MSAPRWLEEAEVTTVVGPCTPISRFCKCRRKTLNLRGVDRSMAQLRDCLLVAAEAGQEPPHGDADLLTYRRLDCKKIARITMTMLGLEI